MSARDRNLADQPSVDSPVPPGAAVPTLDAMSSPDKTLLRFGRRDGHYDDYGHCDLVWSRHAPQEIFPPVIDWLDRRQPGAVGTPPRPQPAMTSRDDGPSPVERTSTPSTPAILR